MKQSSRSLSLDLSINKWSFTLKLCNNSQIQWMASGVPGENGPSVLAPVAVELRPGRESVKPRSSVLVLTLIRRSVTLIHVVVAQTKVNIKSYLDQLINSLPNGGKVEI